MGTRPCTAAVWHSSAEAAVHHAAVVPTPCLYAPAPRRVVTAAEVLVHHSPKTVRWLMSTGLLLLLLRLLLLLLLLLLIVLW